MQLMKRTPCSHSIVMYICVSSDINYWNGPKISLVFYRNLVRSKM